MLRQGAVGEYRLVGQERHAGEAGDRRHDGRRTGGDDEPPRPDHEIPGTHRTVIEKSRFGGDDAHPEPLEPLDRVVWRDPRDDPRDAVGDAGEIDLWRRVV